MSNYELLMVILAIGALIGCLVKGIIGDTLPFTQGNARSRKIGVRRIAHHPHYARSHEGGDTDE